MFILNKYVPKQFNTSKLNTKYISKLKKLDKYNFMNILFYGCSGTGKYTLGLMLLNHIFNNEIYTLKEQLYENNGKEITYYSSNYHFEIYLTKYSNKKILFELIDNLTKTLNIRNNCYNVILLKNVHYLDTEFFNSIKNIIEKRYDSVKFIFTTNCIDKVPLYFRSFFINFRIAKFNYNEMSGFLNKVIDYENIDITNEKLKELVMFHKFNISKILLNLENYKKTKIISNNSYLEQHLDLILKLIYSKDINQIESIRKLLYALSSKNIDKNIIIHYIYSNVLQKINDTQQKIKYIDFVAELNQRMHYSYKNIIHLEYLLINSLRFIE